MTIDLQLILQLFLAVLGFYFLAFWVSLVVWTYRDISARTQDIFVQALGVAIVLFFSIPGMFLYYILRPRETLAEAFDRSLEEETLLRDLEERDDCPVCQHPIRADYQFCPNCQTQLRNVCGECGRLLELHWERCPFCGTEVPREQVVAVVAGPAIEEEVTPEPETREAVTEEIVAPR